MIFLAGLILPKIDFMTDMNAYNVAIVDYGMCNLFSVHHACQHVGLKPLITADGEEILRAAAIILPGVGAFGEAMRNLSRLNLIGPIKEMIARGKPFMGICLGMQLLLSESEEFGAHEGLGIIEGKVVKFPQQGGGPSKKIRVPQIGWNRIYPPEAEENAWQSSPLKQIKPGEFMYFVHSYYAIPTAQEMLLSLTTYEGVEYCSSICMDNVFACQFHPEKSGKEGLKIYQQWADIVRNKRGVI